VVAAFDAGAERERRGHALLAELVVIVVGVPA